jgi:hypothetical protein
MSDRTGFCKGTLNPVIYFERGDGYAILAPQEVGQDLSLARRIYEERYHPQGWEWREAATLQDVDRLQKKLVEQEESRLRKMADVNGFHRERAMAQTASDLRARMCSSATSSFERDFISAYLKMREDKRDKYRDRLMEHNFYLWASAMDSGTKVEDRMPSQPGEFWRAGA